MKTMAGSVHRDAFTLWPDLDFSCNQKQPNLLTFHTNNLTNLEFLHHDIVCSIILHVTTTVQTCWMLVWQVVDGYFHSIDLHDHVSVLGVQINITVSAERKMVFSFVSLWMETTVSVLF